MFRHIRFVVVIAALSVAGGSAPRIMAAQEPAADAQADGAQLAADAAADKTSNDVYLVQMADAPVITYRGGVGGRAATSRSGHRQKIDVEDADVIGYAQYLDARHDEALSRSGGRKLYGYRYSFNGFAARLTPSEAEALANTEGVVRVIKDELRSITTSSTPKLLGLDEPGGLWNQLAGPQRAGEDIIIGVIDSGVWPESLSFTDRADATGVPSASGRVTYDSMRRWRNRCQVGEAFTTDNCNNKLIGAQHFNGAWGGDAAIATSKPWEFTSPRDYNGHGTHTASTAGGNHGVPTDGDAVVFKSISGVAPRARIAVYKALWSLQDGSRADGFTSDLVAAIDKAVADGVDVINYSVAGSTNNIADPVEIAFFNAASSGVFVAASAGNTGSAPGTVAHPSPWITTVGAATHSRSGSGSVTLGNGATYAGASFAVPVSAPIVTGTAAALPGQTNAARQCFGSADPGGIPALDPAKVGGKIVVCERAGGARINKSVAVKEAGGVGMILVNTSATQPLDVDFHLVPSINLNLADGAAVKAYAAAPNASATIAQATITHDKPAPLMAGFSARGPMLAGGGDLLKPDLVAPGQDILAAVAPPGNANRSFNIYSGTSMSTPHVAGLAALMMHLKREDGEKDHDHNRDGDRGRRGRNHDDDHEDQGWSPMMIKSALMTTGIDVLLGGERPLVPNTCATAPAGTVDPCWLAFSQGAGHVVPNRAMNPGLVFDSDEDDWVAFMCGAAPQTVHPWDCWSLKRRGFSFDASDLNVPSIAIGELVGAQTVTRTVTNVGRSRATYTASFTGMNGIDVRVSPASFTIRPGKSQKIKVTFTRTTASVNAYTGGHLTLTDGNHDVRVPMAVRPIPFVAPAEVFSNGDAISYPVRFGYTGSFTATVRGLVPATVTAGSVADDPTDQFVPQRVGPDIFKLNVTVPAGTTLARFSIFQGDVAAGADLDLFVYRGASFVAASAQDGSNEEVNLPNPAVSAAVTYTVYVHGYAVDGTSPFSLHTWLVGQANEGNVAITAPAAATTGATENINLVFSNLTTGAKYLGTVNYTGSIGMAPTIVRVDP